jgi:hypothetical protein
LVDGSLNVPGYIKAMLATATDDDHVPPCSVAVATGEADNEGPALVAGLIQDQLSAFLGCLNSGDALLSLIGISLAQTKGDS